MRDIRSRKAPKLYAANNTEIKVLGEVKLQIAYGGKCTKETIVICDTEKSDVLLSWKCCQELNIIPQDFPNPIRAIN